MRGMILTFCLLAVPLVAVGQAPGDTVQVVIPPDKNCGDFRSEFAVQQLFGFGLVATGGDVFGLDSDGDGQPCEGQEWAKVETVSEGYAVRYTLAPAEIVCEMRDEPFSLDGLKKEIIGNVKREIPRRGDIGYDLRWDCLHIISSKATQ